MKKKKKKKKTTFSWGDEPIDSERQPSVIKAEDEDEDESENAPPATNQTRRPLQEVESPRPEEETTGPPARSKCAENWDCTLTNKHRTIALEDNR